MAKLEECEYCGQEFMPKGRQRFCCNRHREQAYYRDNRSQILDRRKKPAVKDGGRCANCNRKLRIQREFTRYCSHRCYRRYFAKVYNGFKVEVRG